MADHNTFTDISLPATVSPLFVIPDVCVSTLNLLFSLIRYDMQVLDVQSKADVV